MTSEIELSDTEIIQNVLSGNCQAFELLIRKHNPYLYRIGKSFGYNHQDVEDLMQETFLKAYEGLRKLRNSEYFKTWLNRIMLNECFRKSKRIRFRRKAEIGFVMSEKSLSDSNNSLDTNRKVVTRELNGVLTQAISHIPANYQAVFALRELNGLTVHETAITLNLTETNVKVRLYRAKGLLRKEVEKAYSYG
jgi:RNA polymerase sigma-70 factor (ECF subfamily)